jgi:hypothetical protein
VDDRYDVTIALTTRNRASLLARTLDHMRRLRVPPGLRWELLVVNNNSTDDTAHVLGGVTDLPIRSFFEQRDGKSNAANTATERARGDLIVWTDDDVRPDPGWLEAYVHAAEWHPDAAYFGGPVRPWFESKPPPWLERGFRVLGVPYGLLDLGPEARPFVRSEKPIGPNMAIRRAAARQHRWDPLRGPRATTQLMGAETYVVDRMREAGLVGRWVPQAVVEHFVPAERMTLEYVRMRCRLQGRTVAHDREGMVHAACAILSLLASYPRYAVLRALGASPARWLRQYRRAQAHLGEIEGYRSRGAPGGTPPAARSP